MAFTANKNLEQVPNGADVGTWDVPTNSNWGIVDASFGATAVVPLTNAPVTLSAAQYQCAFITFTGALSGNCAITFPPVGSFYVVQNLTSNTSAFQVTLGTTVAGAEIIGCPWGQAVDIWTAGINMRFRSLDKVGAYWDYAGSSVPAWVSACTVPPYLNCDGTAFSSATYPILATILGGTTLPDTRGRARSALNQGTGRLTTAANAVDGNTLLAGGGGTVTLSSVNLPNISFPVTDPTHTHAELVLTVGGGLLTVQGNVGGALPGTATGMLTAPSATGITVNSGGSGTPVTMATPTLIAGITMVRAA